MPIRRKLSPIAMILDSYRQPFFTTDLSLSKTFFESFFLLSYLLYGAFVSPLCYTKGIRMIIEWLVPQPLCHHVLDMESIILIDEMTHRFWKSTLGSMSWLNSNLYHLDPENKIKSPSHFFSELSTPFVNDYKCHPLFEMGKNSFTRGRNYYHTHIWIEWSNVSFTFVNKIKEIKILVGKWAKFTWNVSRKDEQEIRDENRSVLIREWWVKIDLSFFSLDRIGLDWTFIRIGLIL